MRHNAMRANFQSMTYTQYQDCRNEIRSHSHAIPKSKRTTLTTSDQQTLGSMSNDPTASQFQFTDFVSRRSHLPQAIVRIPNLIPSQLNSHTSLIHLRSVFRSTHCTKPDSRSGGDCADPHTPIAAYVDVFSLG